MTRLRALLMRMRSVVAGGRRERELAEELESHLQLHIEDGIRAGMRPEDARRAALLKFGPIESIKEQYRDRSTIRVVETLAQDLRYAARSLGRHRSFALLSVGTLALGVGATAAMFGLVDALMLRPLPQIPDAGRVVTVEDIANYARYTDIGPRLRALDLAAFTRSTVSLGAGLDARPIKVECVTPNYFSVLGVTPSPGRAFIAEEDAPGNAPVAVIANRLWTGRFGGNPDIVGTHVGIGGRGYTIVGVAPERFMGVGAEAVDAWLLLRAHPEACTFGSVDLSVRGGFWLSTIGRIRRGATWEQAASDVIAADTNPETARRQRHDGTIETFRITRPPKLIPVRAATLQPASSEDRLALWLAGGAAVLLLIACANVGSLHAMRAVARRREIAIRLQLGASRGRVFAQLLTESLLIAGLCAIAATMVAVWVAALLRTFYANTDAGEILNPRVGSVIAAFAVLAGLISGTIPAIQASRADVSSYLRTGRGVHERTRLRTGLLIVQMALGLLLIVSAGLFVRSVASFRADLGYDLDRVLAASADLGKAGYRDPADARARYDLMLSRVRQLPDVEAAALSSNVVLGERGGTVTSIARRPNDPAGCCHASVSVSPDYFVTLGIRMQKGRAFTAADARPGAVPVVILDEDLAKAIFSGADPLGQCVMVAFATTCQQVVGVAESGRRGPLRKSQLDSEFFLPLADAAAPGAIVPQTLLVRPRTTSRRTVSAIGAAIRSAAPDLPYVDIQPLTDLANMEASSWRMGAALFGLFAVLAVILAAVGIYGALAFSMRQRTPEIGVRLAFGASPAQIASMVVRHALVVAGAGWAAGAAATLLLVRYLQSLLFDAPGGIPSFVGASAVILLAALAGAIVPAIRASRVDPVAALRAE